MDQTKIAEIILKVAEKDREAAYQHDFYRDAPREGLIDWLARIKSPHDLTQAFRLAHPEIGQKQFTDFVITNLPDRAPGLYDGSLKKWLSRFS